jgi:hypothetical protein
MKTIDLGRPLAFRDLPGGACFVFDGTNVGFKVARPKTVDQISAISLSNGAITISENDLRGHVFQIADATIVPIFAPLTMKPGATFEAHAGALVFHNSEIYLSFKLRDGIILLANAETGEPQRTLPDENFTWTDNWNVLTKVLDENVTIFSNQPH